MEKRRQEVFKFFRGSQEEEKQRSPPQRTTANSALVWKGWWLLYLPSEKHVTEVQFGSRIDSRKIGEEAEGGV